MTGFVVQGHNEHQISILEIIWFLKDLKIEVMAVQNSQD